MIRAEILVFVHKYHPDPTQRRVLKSSPPLEQVPLAQQCTVARYHLSEVGVANDSHDREKRSNQRILDAFT